MKEVGISKKESSKSSQLTLRKAKSQDICRRQLSYSHQQSRGIKQTQKIQEKCKSAPSVLHNKSQSLQHANQQGYNGQLGIDNEEIDYYAQSAKYQIKQPVSYNEEFQWVGQADPSQNYDSLNSSQSSITLSQTNHNLVYRFGQQENISNRTLDQLLIQNWDQNEPEQVVANYMVQVSDDQQFTEYDSESESNNQQGHPSVQNMGIPQDIQDEGEDGDFSDMYENYSAEYYCFGLISKDAKADK